MPMKPEPKKLSFDPKELHEIIDALSTEIASLKDKNQSLEEENQFIRAQLILLRRKQFGHSSEKIKRQIDNLQLRLEENELVNENVSEEDKLFGDIEKILGSDKEEEKAKKNEKPKKKPKRKRLPEDLPREEVIIPAPQTCSSCGGEKFRKIADDVSEILEYVPAHYKIIRFIRPRCACVTCEHIMQGYAQSKPIDKGKAGAGLLAHIIVQKYCDHLPMYRQSQIYAREGIDLPRSTLASWAGQCARLLEPLVNELRKSIFASSEIHGDDTPIKVLAPGTGKTKTGRLWTYVRNGKPHGDNSPPAVCYFYSPDRTGERPREHLKDFTGILHADAYSGYNQVYLGTESKITEAACWAHTRRKFYEVTVSSDKAVVAFEILERIGEIYAIEEKINGSAPNTRLETRQKVSKKLVEQLFTSFKEYYVKLPKKSPTALAIAYALNNEVALKRFLENGRIEIDNNAAERAMRAIALGRKNWLFAGSDAGGETAANIYSLIETAKLNKINPWKYLHYALSVIQDHPASKLEELLPWNVKLI
jgi:transposase